LSATPTQTPSPPDALPITAQDVFNNTATNNSSTVVTMTSNGAAQFDSNGDTVFGDNTKTLTAGTFTISTKDNVAQSVILTATDPDTKTTSPTSSHITTSGT